MKGVCSDQTPRLLAQLRAHSSLLTLTLHPSPVTDDIHVPHGTARRRGQRHSPQRLARRARRAGRAAARLSADRRRCGARSRRRCCDDYFVVCPDLRGYGDSDKPRDGYDKRTMARDIHLLMEALGHRPLCGGRPRSRRARGAPPGAGPCRRGDQAVRARHRAHAHGVQQHRRGARRGILALVLLPDRRICPRSCSAPRPSRSCATCFAR